MNRRRITAALGLLMVVCGATVAIAATHGASASDRPALRGDAVWAAGSRPAPGFALHDQGGRAVSLTSLRGQPLLLVFLDSKCRTFCPVVGQQLGAAQRLMGNRPVRLVTISVDGADTPASVRAAARHWRWSGPWTWLMGTHGQLTKAWRGYGITVKPTAADITHSIAVYLIDANGNERAAFLPPLTLRDVVGDVRALRNEGGNA